MTFWAPHRINPADVNVKIKTSQVVRNSWSAGVLSLLKVQVYQVRSLDRPLFIVFAQNSEGIIVTSQTREQGMMECAVSSSLFSVYVIKKRVH